MAKILILIGGHLCTAPRPLKEADALARAGHQVLIHGVWFDPVLVDRDRQLLADQPWQFQPVLDFCPNRPLTRLGVRSQSRLVREGYRRWGHISPALLGYGARAMLRAALRERPDLTIVHSEAGLWVGDQLLNRGWRVGVDFEDWFSQDLLPQAQASRPIAHLKQLEHRLMQQCTYCLTTSQALADTLAQVYQAPQPTVIYNVFPQTDYPQTATNPAIPRLHWFSQTIGPGRGLETLFQALPRVTTPVELHLRGHCAPPTQTWLHSQIPAHWHDRVFVHPTVSNAQLPARIAEHDIGLALEQADPPSRNLTITNKLFQYLQAGLAVIATDTAGQREVATHCPEAVHLVANGNPTQLAQAIDRLASRSPALAAAKAAARQAAQTHFCWEHHRDRLLAAADRALSEPHTGAISVSVWA